MSWSSGSSQYAASMRELDIQMENEIAEAWRKMENRIAEAWRKIDEKYAQEIAAAKLARQARKALKAGGPTRGGEWGQILTLSGK